MAFTQPLFLLVLATVPYFVYLGLPKGRYGRGRAWAALVLRCVAATLIVLSLAGAQLVRGSDELAIVSEFLPQQLSRDAVASIVGEAIAESGAASIKDLGGVMKLVNPWPDAKGIASDPPIKDLAGRKMFEVPMEPDQKITFHPEGTAPQRTEWRGRPATEPRSVVRVIQEKMPAGHRNSPLQPPVKYADRCTLWLGKPKAEIPENDRDQ